MEPSIRFRGRVFPAALNLTIRKHPTLKIRDIGEDYDMLFDVAVENGEVTVDCFVEDYREELHYSPLFTRAFDAVSASVNLASFGMGVRATAVLETSVDRNGTEKILVFRDRELEDVCTAFSVEEESFDAVLEYVFHDMRLSSALHDLTEGIAIPHVIP
jgi:hypothetical protein